jgi:hypothetical protein
MKKKEEVPSDLDIPPLTKADFKRARRVTPGEHRIFHGAVQKFTSARRRRYGQKGQFPLCP